MRWPKQSPQTQSPQRGSSAGSALPSGDDAPVPPVARPPRWRSWLANLAVFSVALLLALSLFSAMADFVESFFLTLYSD